VDGVTFHTIAYAGTGEGGASKLTTVNYVFAAGYLIAGPDRGLLRQAIQTQASGTSILSDAKFRALLPADQYTGFSGVFFQQAAGALASLASSMAANSGAKPEQVAAMEQLAKELKPTLVAAYADSRSVTVASKSGLFGLGGNSLLRMGLLLDLFGKARTPSSGSPN
jgi:hypothetical protein